MKLSLDVLRQFTDLPADPRDARILLDEVGLEVKRIDASRPGVPVTLELLANRGDHHCLVGLAREVTGRTGGSVTAPPVTTLVPGGAPHPVRVETDLCAVYALTALTKVGDGALAAEHTARLEACSQRVVHPVVDATNLANLELGQPTHAFDADTIVGPVTIRLARKGEQAWPLFAEAKVEVPEGAVVIADDEKILAIAGVIGCEESKTTDATTRVLLESAAFDPVAVRKASRALGIHTDSSARFERGSDFAAVLTGSGRVAHVLSSAGWTVGDTFVHRASDLDARLSRTVPFSPAACRAFLAVDESDDALWGRLSRYGFVRVDDAVVVPTWRLWDVDKTQDLYEEIAKSIGYDNTPIGLPPIDMGALPSHAERVLDTVADVFVGNGFYEVITDGFHGRELPALLGFTGDHLLATHVQTANALDRAYSLLKNNCLGQAIEGVALNTRMKHDVIKAFEVTKVFAPSGKAANGLCEEHRMLWAIAAGDERPRTWAGSSRQADVAWLKGLVLELGLALGLPLSVRPFDGAAMSLASALHPGRRASIYLGEQRVGVLGEVHPTVVAAFKLKRLRPVYLEIAFGHLTVPATARAFVEPPRVPPVERDVAFTLPRGVTSAEVIDVLTATGPTWLNRVEVVDRFVHDEDGVTVSTLTFRLWYANDEGDRTTDALNGAMEAGIAAVVATLGARGVKLRA